MKTIAIFMERKTLMRSVKIGLIMELKLVILTLGSEGSKVIYGNGSEVFAEESKG